MRLILLCAVLSLLLACAKQRPVESLLEATVSAPLATDVPAKGVYQVSYSSLLPLSAAITPDTYRSIKYGDDALQFGQLYLPTLQRETQPPLVVFIHGGCWLNKYDIGHSQAFSYALAQQGYAVWSLEYRRTGDTGGGWPGSFQDILQALQSLAALSTTVDTERVVIAGHSAGGHLALLAGSALRHQPHIKGVIGLAAITDIQRYSAGDGGCQQAARQFLAINQTDSAKLLEANPINLVAHPITLLLQGDADKIVPLEQATDSGLAISVAAGVGHFDWIHPEAAAYKTLLSTLNGLFSP